MPIHNSDRTIIGVTQLINKVNGQPFDDNDQHIIEVGKSREQYSQSHDIKIEIVASVYPVSMKYYVLIEN